MTGSAGGSLMRTGGRRLKLLQLAFPELPNRWPGPAPPPPRGEERKPAKSNQHRMAQVDGSGTVNAPEEVPSVSRLDAVGEKKRVSGLPAGPRSPNIKSQRPPAVLPLRGQGLTGSSSTRTLLSVALKALIPLSPKGKIGRPASRHRTGRKPAGAIAMPHGEASSPVDDALPQVAA